MANIAFDNSGYGPLQVPGYNGVNLDDGVDPLNGFCSDGYDAGWEQLPRVTVRELIMLDVMAKITDKPAWDMSILDDAVVKEWRDEALSVPLISEKCWDWCLAELRDKAAVYRDTGHLVVLDVGACIYKSDKIVPASVQENFQAATPALLAQYHQDWGNESYFERQELIDPSLFLLNFSRTLVLAQGGRIDLEDTFDVYNRGLQISDTSQFRNPTDQWLPCEVEFSTTGSETDVCITSYINNLHPMHHKSLYGTIEKLMSLAVEAWNRVLIKNSEITLLIPENPSEARQVIGRVPVRIRTFGAEYDPPYPWDLYNDAEGPSISYEPNPSMREVLARCEAARASRRHTLPARVEEYLRTTEDGSASPAQLPHNWEADLAKSVADKARRLCRLQLPEPGMSFSYEEWKLGKTSKAVHPHHDLGPGDVYLPDGDHDYYQVKLQETFKAKGLQIVVRLSSIQLDPISPSFPGAAWTQDSVGNEHLVGTAVYCFDVENVSGTSVSFQQRTDMYPAWYDIDFHAEMLLEIFGLRDPSELNHPETPGQYINVGGSAAQPLGTSTISSGRLLAWSSAIKHRLEPFSLTDTTKPGHCRFITLYLVDPNIRICSTRNVPPQRHDWWADPAFASAQLPFPQEIQDMIRDLTLMERGPMSLHEAKEFKRRRDEALVKFDEYYRDHPGTIDFSSHI